MLSSRLANPFVPLAILSFVIYTAHPLCAQEKSEQRDGNRKRIVIDLPVGQSVDSVKGASWPRKPRNNVPDDSFGIHHEFVIRVPPIAGSDRRGLVVIEMLALQENGVIENCVCHFGKAFTFQGGLKEIDAAAKVLGVDQQKGIRSGLKSYSKTKTPPTMSVFFNVLVGYRLLGEFTMGPVPGDKPGTTDWRISYATMSISEDEWKDRKYLDEKDWQKFNAKRK
jgi:hypothetical protein